MFTLPIGNFPAYTTTVRPSANTVTSGVVNNAANAYDNNLGSYADFGNAVWSVQTVPGGLIGNPTIYVQQDIDIEYAGGVGSSAYSVKVSTDGGTTYPYTIYSGGGANSAGTIVRAGVTDFVYIAGSVTLSNIYVKFSCATTGGVYAPVPIKIYDVRVVY